MPADVINVPRILDLHESGKLGCHFTVIVDEVVVTSEPFLAVNHMSRMNRQAFHKGRLTLTSVAWSVQTLSLNFLNLVCRSLLTCSTMMYDDGAEGSPISVPVDVPPITTQLEPYLCLRTRLVFVLLDVVIFRREVDRFASFDVGRLERIYNLFFGLWAYVWNLS